jgi:non-specific serine/threonine protein kinase
MVVAGREGGSELATPPDIAGAITSSPAFEGAYQLVTGTLQPAERQLLRRLAILPDGLTLAGTIAMASRLDHDPGSKVPSRAAEQVGPMQDLLNRLVASGLVVAGAQTNGEVRYRVEGSLRAALVKELERSDECTALREAAIQHLTQCAEIARQEYFGPRQMGWLNVVADERDNLREALHWVTNEDASSRQVALGVSLGAAHVATWLLQGNLEEGRIWLRRIVSVLPRLAADDVAQTREQADDLQIALGLLSALQGDAETCRQTLTRYPARAVNAADPSGRRRLLVLARIALEANDLPAATAYLEPIISHSGKLIDTALLRSREDLWDAGVAAALFSQVLVRGGHPAAAVGPLRRAEDWIARTADQRAIAYVALAQGDVFGHVGEDDRAVAAYVEALAESYDLDESSLLCPAMIGLAEMSLKRGAPGQAALWLGSAHALRCRSGGLKTRWEQERFSVLVEQVQQKLAPEAAKLRFAQGARAPLSVVAEVASGSVEFDDAALSEPEPESPAVSDPALASGLTPLQRDILRLLVIGRPHRDIALNLHVRPDVVQDEVTQMIRRLGVSTRLALGAEAIARRLV